MGPFDDVLPLPAPRPIEADDALVATIHALAALAAGIAAMQLLSAVALGNVVLAAFFASILAATAACAFASDERGLRGWACLAGGGASILVWLSLAAQASGAATLVAGGMVAASVAVTRAVVGTRDLGSVTDGVAPRLGEPSAWITDDREGMLAA